MPLYPITIPYKLCTWCGQRNSLIAVKCTQCRLVGHLEIADTPIRPEPARPNAYRKDPSC